VENENDVDGYTDFIKRVCFGKQLKPKALGIFKMEKRTMIRKVLIVMIVSTFMLSNVYAQLFAKWRMPDNRLRFILTLPEDQDGEGYFNWCYGGNPMKCNTRAMFAENITIGSILQTKIQQEKGIWSESIVLDSSLHIKFNVDLQVPAGEEYRLLAILSQYTLAYFDADYTEYTKMTPGYSLMVLDEDAKSLPPQINLRTVGLNFDGTTATFKGPISFLAYVIHDHTGEFVWDKSGIKGRKEFSFTVEDDSSLDSWLIGLSELGLGAEADSASVNYVEIYKRSN